MFTARGRTIFVELVAHSSKYPYMGALLLIVEDDHDIREMLQSLLADEGYEVLVAGNGQEALLVLQKQARIPALILLDLMMPVMDGYAFLEATRAQAHLNTVPVLMLTASHAAKTPGISGYLKKPLDLEELLTVVQRLVSAPQ